MRGLLIGRFQPFHLGHLKVVQHLRSARPKETLILGIGSAEASFTAENPFTAGERAEMISRALTAAGIDGWMTQPVADVHRHALWVAHVTELVPTFERVYTNNPLTRLLFERAGFAVDSPPLFDREKFEGAQIRRALRSGGDWAGLVPPAVGEFLRSIAAEDRMRRIAEDRHP